MYWYSYREEKKKKKKNRSGNPSLVASSALLPANLDLLPKGSLAARGFQHEKHRSWHKDCPKPHSQHASSTGLNLNTTSHHHHHHSVPLFSPPPTTTQTHSLPLQPQPPFSLLPTFDHSTLFLSLVETFVINSLVYNHVSFFGLNHHLPCRLLHRFCCRVQKSSLVTRSLNTYARVDNRTLFEKKTRSFSPAGLPSNRWPFTSTFHS